jgi:hypothetical protein
MKKSITFLIFILSLLYSVTTVAQQGINYKALIKDANNAVVANTTVTVQFIVYEGAGETNNVYQETHTPTTDANGIIIITIGQGTSGVIGVFDDINWAIDAHFLNTQIDTGAGLVDMSTTGFNAVPYALSAKTAENVTGLQYADETDDTIDNGGLFKVGRVAANYGTIGENAVDLSVSNFASIARGATSIYSTAMGSHTSASGSASTAMGSGTSASGSNSTTMGENTRASGEESTAMGGSTSASGRASTAIGSFTIASGNYSTAMGSSTNAESYGQTTLGLFNVRTTPNSATAINVFDRLFVVGNGLSRTLTSDALVILKNGTITAPSFGIAQITDPKALVTKEYADSAGTGLEAINESNGNGLVKVGRVPFNYGNVGGAAVDLSSSPTPNNLFGATGDYSTAMGLRTRAFGYGATAMGSLTSATGNYSTAMGYQTSAIGASSTAMGYRTSAIGAGSTAMGFNTRAEALNSTAIGLYNVGGGSLGLAVATDPVFEIGNGTSSGRSNALTVYKNGNMEVAGAIQADGHVYGNRYAFSAYANDFVALSSVDPDYFALFNDVTDPYNLINNSGIFVAPRTGLYFFSTSLTFANGNGADDTMYMGFSVDSNTTLLSQITINPRALTSSGVEHSYSYTMVLSLTQGQTVRVLVKNISTTSPVDVTDRTFTGYYLGE